MRIVLLGILVYSVPPPHTFQHVFGRIFLRELKMSSVAVVRRRKEGELSIAVGSGIGNLWERE